MACAKRDGAAGDCCGVIAPDCDTDVDTDGYMYEPG